MTISIPWRGISRWFSRASIRRRKKYVGADVVLKQQIAEVQADKKMPPADKKAALAELNAGLEAIVPVQITANIDLVLKHFDELAAEEPQPNK